MITNILVALIFLFTSSTGRVVTLGDSLTAGKGGQGTTYPNVVWGQLGPSWTVENHGINGDTAAMLWVRCQAEVLCSNCVLPEVLIVLGGINDVAYQNTIHDIEANLSAIYRVLAERGVRVVAVTLLPAMAAGGWPAGSQETIEAVNAWIRSKPMGVETMIDAYTLFGDPMHPENLSPLYDSGDGVHLNAAGYALLGQSIYAGVPW